MTLSTYAHLFEELDGADRSSAEDRIRHARRTRFEGHRGRVAGLPGDLDDVRAFGE